MPVDPGDFREGLSRFASGVTVVTTRDGDGSAHGLTVSAFCSLSLEPPLILICIEKGIRSHDALSASSHFVVNVLNADQMDISNRFASQVDDRFDGIATRPGIDGIPVIEDAVATIECSRYAALDGGDHTIFVGLVEAISVSDASPLLYFRSNYRSLES